MVVDVVYDRVVEVAMVAIDITTGSTVTIADKSDETSELVPVIPVDITVLPTQTYVVTLCP